MMDKLTTADLLPNSEYLRVRDDYRKEMITYKKHRRVQIGPRVTFVFENRKTMKFQIQEILRVENIAGQDGIESELKVYNGLLPGEGELCATMMIAFSRTEAIRQEMDDMLGVTADVHLAFGPHQVQAEFEQDRTTDVRISAVQYSAFRFTPAQRAAFVDPEAEVTLVIAHGRYDHSTTLPSPTRASLAEDLD